MTSRRRDAGTTKQTSPGGIVDSNTRTDSAVLNRNDRFEPTMTDAYGTGGGGLVVEITESQLRWLKVCSGLLAVLLAILLGVWLVDDSPQHWNADPLVSCRTSTSRMLSIGIQT